MTSVWGEATDSASPPARLSSHSSTSSACTTSSVAAAATAGSPAGTATTATKAAVVQKQHRHQQLRKRPHGSDESVVSGESERSGCSCKGRGNSGGGGNGSGSGGSGGGGSHTASRMPPESTGSMPNRTWGWAGARAPRAAGTEGGAHVGAGATAASSRGGVWRLKSDESAGGGSAVAAPLSTTPAGGGVGGGGKRAGDGELQERVLHLEAALVRSEVILRL